MASLKVVRLLKGGQNSDSLLYDADGFWRIIDRECLVSVQYLDHALNYSKMLPKMGD